MWFVCFYFNSLSQEILEQGQTYLGTVPGGSGYASYRCACHLQEWKAEGWVAGGTGLPPVLSPTPVKSLNPNPPTPLLRLVSFSCSGEGTARKNTIENRLSKKCFQGTWEGLGDRVTQVGSQLGKRH